MTTPDALQYLSRLEGTGIVFGLDNIRRILERLNNPHRSLKTVHIAGTNGKGSVASMLSTVFTEAGYRTGKYTSPHLLSFNERITVNEIPIADDRLFALIDETRDRVDEAPCFRSFTFFDFSTALAIRHFEETAVDIAFIETGLGGRLDSTNIINPLATVITNVGLDHTDYLGSSVREIAGEKAGIIKESTPVITGATGEAYDVIAEKARSLKAPVHALHRDFTYRKVSDQHMDYRGLTMTCDNLSVGLLGDHQLSNAALALCGIEILGEAGFPVSTKDIRKGMEQVVWPGRLEIVHRDPMILLDGAHNPDGMGTLAEFISRTCRNMKKILIFGVMKDKDYQAMFRSIEPLVDTVILTRPQMERALHPEKMELSHSPILSTGSVHEALVAAAGIARKEDCIIVSGSLFTVGEAKGLIHEIF